MSIATPGSGTMRGSTPLARAAARCGESLSSPKRSGTTPGGLSTTPFEPFSSCAGAMVKAGVAPCAASSASTSTDVTAGTSPGMVSTPEAPSAANTRAAAVTLPVWPSRAPSVITRAPRRRASAVVQASSVTTATPASPRAPSNASSTSPTITRISATRSSGESKGERRCFDPAISFTGSTAQSVHPQRIRRGEDGPRQRHLVVQRPHQRRRAEDARRDAARVVAFLHDIALQQPAVACGGRGGGRWRAQLGEHFRRWPLHRLPGDDGGYGDHRRTTGGDGVAHPRHRQDRLDADERVARADHHGARLPQRNAASTAGCGRAVAAPANSTARTTGAARCRTNQSWKSGIQPSSPRMRAAPRVVTHRQGINSNRRYVYASTWFRLVLLLPISDDPVRTRIRGDSGWIDFQDWFVRQRAARWCARGFAGAAEARPPPALLAALRAGRARW